MSDLPVPPTAPREPTVHTLHGDRRDDPHGWLREPDARTLAHLEAENAYTDAMTAHLQPLRDALYAEMLGRIQEDDVSAPIPHGPWVYRVRTEEGKAYGVHVRAPRGGGAEQVVLDENARAEGADYYRLGGLSISDDHAVVAFTEDLTGRERYTLHVVEVATGRALCAPIPDVCAPVELTAGADAVLYTTPDDAERPHRAVLHPLGGAPRVLLQEDDERFFVGVGSTRDGRYLLVELGSKLTTEVHYVDRAAPGAIACVAARRQGVEYEVAHRAGTWWILTNDGARDFRIATAPVGDADPAHWTEVVPPTDGLYLTGIDTYARHVVVEARQGGLTAVLVVDPDTGAWRAVPFDEPVYTVEAGTTRSFDAAAIRLRYSSPITPDTDLDLDPDTLALTVVKRRPVPGGYDPAQYATARMWATATDGTRVPISVAHRRDVSPDGTAPLLLQGYGAYGICYDPAFSTSRLALLDRGVVVAIAHVRGGGELGRSWYEQGRTAHKERSFTDLIACAEALIAAGWTTSARLGLWGGSAGGLLVGATLNARPDLFRVVLALVPFVDALTTMLDPSLPLTVTEYEEWGNPEEPDVYERMRRYAPYDNVPETALPAVLATGGFTDPRVGFWEPSKWVLRLRERQRGDAPILLHMHLGAGHGGPSGRYGQLEELARLYAFFLDQVGAAG